MLLLIPFLASAAPATAQNAQTAAAAGKQQWQPPKLLDARPSGFDAPVYNNNIIETKYTDIAGRSGGSTQTAIAKTKDAPTTVFQWYQNALRANGWEIEPAKPPAKPIPLQEQGNLYMAKAHKEGYSLFFFCTHPKATAYTTVNVSVSKSQAAAR